VKNKIWLVNFYAMPPKLESRLRTIKFAHYLKHEGYEVKIFASSVMHNMGINLINSKQKFIEESYGDINFVHIKSPSYNSNGFGRFISLIVFHFRLHFLHKHFFKPDIIIHTALPPFGNITYFTAKKLNAKYIVEVLDLWPESFLAFGLIRKSNPFLFLAYYLEKWLYKKADEIVFSMEGGKDYIIEKKWDKASGGPVNLKHVHYINNGVDIKDFDTFKQIHKLEDPDINNSTVFKVIYIGSIRLANNLLRLVDAASLLKDESNIKILIYGDGNDRMFLEEYCNKNKITNVIFKEKWVDPEYVPFILSKSDLNILNYMPNEIFKYGGSQSKFFQYLASGKPICSNLKMGYCLINKYNLGIAKQFDNNEEYAEAINSIVHLEPNAYQAMCNRSRELAKEFDYQILTKKLMSVF